MEEWQATIEREFSGGAPLSNRPAESRDPRRWWHGPGIYGDYGRQAVSTLRAEYLNDHDLAYDVWGHPALVLDAAGLRVRVRPGTRGVPEHLYGCPIAVEYVDPWPMPGWPPLWNQLGPLIARLNTEDPMCVPSWGGETITLAAWALPVAEELHRQFGDQVQLTVGRFRYPPDRQPPLAPVTREVPELLDPAEAEVELDGPAVVASGHTLWHGLLLHSLNGRGLPVATNGQVTADIVDPSTGEIVGGYVGMQMMPGIMFTAPPGGSTRIPLLIGTASSTLRLGYAVPPGHWGLQVTLDLGWGPTAPRRRTPILPLTITAPNQTLRPGLPPHGVPRHRRPGEASA